MYATKKNIQQDTVKRDISIQYTASESTKGRSADKSSNKALYRGKQYKNSSMTSPHSHKLAILTI